MRRYLPCLLITLCLCVPGCRPKDNKPPLLELLSPDKTGVQFSNQLTEDEHHNIITFEYFYNGAGVGIGDINNDGLNDIFFSANQVSNRLYVNKGKLKFEDITQPSGLLDEGKWATGVAMVDIDQDGWLDIYVCYAGPFANPEKRANELYINNHNNTFTEKAAAYGLADTGHTTQAAFFDYDRDGDLDVYLLTNITDQTGPNVIRPKRVKGEMANTDRLYRNNGNHTFTNVSKESGITVEGYGLGVAVCDINHDGWTDIYVSNDYLSNDLLYINNRNGTFTDRASDYFDHTSYSAMGNDVSDFNNDGWLDVLAVDMLPPDNKRQKRMFGSTNYDRYRSEIMTGYAPQFMRNTLQLNRGLSDKGKVVFSEIGQLAGVHATDWSWSALFADIDNDGWKDILITNGYPRDITNRDFVSYRANEVLHEGYQKGVTNKLLTAVSTLDGAYLPNFVFQNKGDLTFEDQSTRWGFTQPSYSTGAAYADLDNDGDLEVVTNNTNGPAFIYENHANDQSGNHFLRFKLVGPPQNRDGLGVKVYLHNAGSIQFQEHSPYRGFQSTVENEIHFGLGTDSLVEEVIIRWLDGKEEYLKEVKGDQTIEVNYAGAPHPPPTLRQLRWTGPPALRQLPPAPRRLRRTGRRAGETERGDVQVRPQDQGPYFEALSGNPKINFKHHETHYADFKIQPLLPHKYSQNGPGVAVADVNNDGLEDFFVGGAFNQSGELFIQKKNGSFESRPLVKATKYEEDMGVLFFDADQDGDKDLYVVSGGNEFQAGSPYYQDRLYFNDGKGNFVLRAEALPSETASGSCVVGADYDQDGDVDLFIGGRLTPQNYPQPGQSFILENQNGKFVDVTNKVAPGLKNSGMVTSALWTDVDNDNQVDLIVVGEWMPVTVYKNKGGLFENSTRTNGPSKSAGWWNSIQGVDLDNDGDTDYVLGNLGLNTKFRTSSENPVRVYVDDFNHDGKQEAVLSNNLQGVNYPAHPRDDLFQQMPQLKKVYPDYESYAGATMNDFLASTGSTHPQIAQADRFESCMLINEGKAGWKVKPLPVEAQVAPVFGIVTGDYNRDGFADVVLTGNSYAPDVLTGRYDAMKGVLLLGDGKGALTPVSIQESGILIDGDAKGLSQLITSDHHVLLLAARNDDSLRVVKSAHEQKFLSVSDHDSYAVVTHKDGRKSKHEFYLGSGYLSQSSRMFQVPYDAKEVVFFDFKGKRRNR